MNFKEMKPYATGKFAVVYLLGEDKVVRKSETELDGFKLILGLTPEERKYFCLPEIFEIDEEDHEWCVIQRLKNVYLDLPEWFCFEKFNKAMSFDERLIPNKEVCELLNAAIELHKYITDMGANVLLDLSETNIMQDDNGKLYLSDPLGCLDI